MSHGKPPSQPLKPDKADGPWPIFALFVLLDVLASGQVLCPWRDMLRCFSWEILLFASTTVAHDEARRRL